MMKWFDESIKTVDGLRKQYKRLLLKYHPDCSGGDEEITKQIIQEYDFLFERFKACNATGKEYADDNADDENKAFKDVLNKIIGYQMEIEIIGSWLWCFESFAYKDRLKEMGFKYAPKKKAWTWHFGEYKQHHKGDISLDDIRAKYGSEKVTHQHKQYALH